MAHFTVAFSEWINVLPSNIARDCKTLPTFEYRGEQYTLCSFADTVRREFCAIVYNNKRQKHEIWDGKKTSNRIMVNLDIDNNSINS